MLKASTKPPAEVGSRLHILSLPYDVRYIIYSHLFPSTRQLYLMAYRKSMRLMMRPGSLSMDIFLTCRQLHLEASGYLFNNYLFNIIGYKKYCMAHYKPVHHLMDKYAKYGSNIEILDNGLLSTTACVSIHAKDGHVEAMLQIRHRGIPRDLQEVEDEAAQLPDIPDEPSEYLYGPCGTRIIGAIAIIMNKLDSITAAYTICALSVVGIAIWIAWMCSGSD